MLCSKPGDAISLLGAQLQYRFVEWEIGAAAVAAGSRFTMKGASHVHGDVTIHECPVSLSVGLRASFEATNHQRSVPECQPRCRGGCRCYAYEIKEGG